jgi:Acetyltransferase (GNAT) domain
VAPSIPFCALRLRWPSPDSYVDAMRASYRRQLRASSRALARAGAHIRRVDDYQPQIPELYRLYRQVMDRAPLQLEQLTLAFFGALKRRFGATSHALLVERDGAILASALVLESPTAHTFLIAGIDYAHHRQTHAYLALVAELIARAIAGGKKLIALGQTSYDLKRRLGADTSPRQIFLRHEQPLAHGLLRLSSGLLFPRRSYPALPVFKGPPLAPS